MLSLIEDCSIWGISEPTLSNIALGCLSDFFVRLQLWAPTIVATFHHSSDGPVGFIIGSGQTFGPCAGLAPHMGHSC